MGRTLLGVIVAAYLLAVGYAAGVVAERIRFDRDRTGVLRRYDDAVRRTHGWLMMLERGQLDATHHGRRTP